MQNHETNYKNCEICMRIPGLDSYDGLSAGSLAPEAFKLQDRFGKPPDPGRDGEFELQCPSCKCKYLLKCDVGGGEWYVSLKRIVTDKT